MVQHSKSAFDLVLALSVKEINETAGPDGLVSSSLLFGKYPRMYMPENLRWRPTNDELGYIALTIPCEMKDHLDKLLITRAFRHNLPISTDSLYETGDKDLVWREKGHTS